MRFFSTVCHHHLPWDRIVVVVVVILVSSLLPSSSIYLCRIHSSYMTHHHYVTRASRIHTPDSLSLNSNSVAFLLFTSTTIRRHSSTLLKRLYFLKTSTCLKISLYRSQKHYLTTIKDKFFFSPYLSLFFPSFCFLFFCSIICTCIMSIFFLPLQLSVSHSNISKYIQYPLSINTHIKH